MSIPAEMRAMAIEGSGDAATLQLVETAVPSPSETQLLIRVEAAGLNRADLRRTQAHFKVSGPVIAGLEVAGTVVACGAEVFGFSPGDRVAAMAPGGYAEFAVAEEASCFRLPANTTAAQGAALATWYMTAHDALVTEGGFKPGDAVLITAAASGIGIAAAQIARAMGAGPVIGTLRKPKQTSAFDRLGFDAVLAGSPDEWRSAVDKATDGKGADVIIDMVGAGMLDMLLDVAAHGGRIVSVGRLGGFHDTLDMDKLALKRLRLIGVTFRTRSREQKAEVRDAMLRDLRPLLEQGKIKPVVDRVFPLEQALAAQEHMAANAHFGKVVLTVAGD